MNLLTAALAPSAILFYVFVYTIWLKRSTVQTSSSAAPPARAAAGGWAAVTGSVELPAADHVRDHLPLDAAALLGPRHPVTATTTRAANVPMLPVVAAPAVVARKILWYSYAMVAATLALVPYAGWIYGVLAAALGAWFVVEAHQLNARGVGCGQARGVQGAAPPRAKTAPMRLFHLSIAYLTLLFAAVAVTALLPWGRW